MFTIIQLKTLDLFCEKWIYGSTYIFACYPLLPVRVTLVEYKFI